MAEAKKEEKKEEKEEKNVPTYRYRNIPAGDEGHAMRNELLKTSREAGQTATDAAFGELDRKAAFGKPEGGRRRNTRKVRILIKHEGDLKKLGYSMDKSARSRHTSLKKAVKRYGRLSTSRKLNALAVFNKRRHPQTARKARADRKFVMK
jgi:hypothetical protein